MHRNLLHKLLQEYLPIAPEEIQAKEATLAFIQQHTNCFERSLEEGHVTASSWLLNKEGTKALLMHHAKLNRWVQLGGHCDGESDVLSVALKEAQEESGIQHIKPVSSALFDIDVHLIPARSKEKAHHHYDIRFLLQVQSDEIIVGNHESKDMQWFGIDENQLPTQERSVVRMHKKWTALC